MDGMETALKRKSGYVMETCGLFGTGVGDSVDF